MRQAAGAWAGAWKTLETTHREGSELSISPAPSRREPPKVLVVAGVHLAALWALGVAQPIFDLLGHNAEFFVARDSEPIDIVLFALALVTVPPLALVTLETLAWLIHQRLREVLHVTFVAMLVAIIALQVLKGIADGSSEALFPLSALLGLGGALVYWRVRPLRSFLTVLSPTPLVVLLLFLFVSPVSKLVTGGEAEASLADVSASAPVVMVVLDELPLSSLLRPDGEIDAERYPSFAAIARDSTWFTRTATTHPNSEHAVPSILTGRWPIRDTLPIVADHPQNVFTLLGRSHRVKVTETLTRLCPSELCREEQGESLGSRLGSLASDLSVVSLHLLLPDDLRLRLPSISGTWRDFRGGPEIPMGRTPVDKKRAEARLGRRHAAAQGDPDRAGTVASFVSKIESPGAGARPPFYFLHILIPHHPWQYLPSGRGYGRGDLNVGLADLEWDNSEAALRGYQRHLLQVGFVDRLLGDLLRRLRTTGMYQRSLVVVTADHGVSFHSNQPFRALTRKTEADVALVPLLVKAPRQHRGRVVDSPLQTTDILPTMADLLGIEIPWRVDGRSGLDPGVARRAFFISNPLFDTRERYPVRRLEAGLAASVARKVAIFGTGDAPPGLYGIGPHPELLGRRAALPMRQSAGLTASIDDPGLFGAVDPKSRFLPVHVSGELHGPGSSRTLDLAVAVNGRVAAVVRSVSGDGPRIFDAMLPESALRPGSNKLEVFEVLEGGRALALLARTSKTAPFTLAEGAIRASSGRRLPIGSPGTEGRLEAIGLAGDRVVVSGWAATRGRPVERVLVFDGARFVGAVTPGVDRPDVGRSFNTSPVRLGFRLEASANALDLSGSGISAFAVDARRAQRLVPLAALCAKGELSVAGCDD